MSQRAQTSSADRWHTTDIQNSPNLNPTRKQPVRTWAGVVGLVLVVAAVVCPIAEPSFGDAAIVAAFELIEGTSVVVCKEFTAQKADQSIKSNERTQEWKNVSDKYCML